MRRFLAVSLILVALTLAFTMWAGPGAAQASPALPSHLLAGPSPTPTLSPAKLPPSGILVPTQIAPDKLPASGGDRPDSSAPLLFGLGGALLTVGVLVWRRQRTVA
jgi:hypothetical protein